MVSKGTQLRETVNFNNAASAIPQFYGIRRILRGEAQESVQLTNAPGNFDAWPSLETNAFS